MGPAIGPAMPRAAPRTGVAGQAVCREATDAEKAANMEQMPRYPGERGMAVTFMVCTWLVTLWILSSFVAVVTNFLVWRYSVLLGTVGAISIILSAYVFKIGLGSLLWVRRYNAAKDEDYHSLWKRRELETGVRDWRSVHHFVIVTAYKEPMEHLMSVAYTLIAQRTLRDESQSFCKQHITLVLAIEQRQGQEALDQVAHIKRQLGSYFRNIISTVHPPNLPHDIAGKASNYKWAVKEIEAMFAQDRFVGISPESSLIHVGDGDSLYDPNHFPYVTWDFCTNPNRDFLMWQPCMLPTCNFWELPSLVRQFTVMVTAQEMMSGSGIGEFQIPFSTYGVGLALLQRIGGEGGAAAAQDGDVITEDHHLFVKGFCATGGRLAVRPVPLPCFNHTVAGWEWRSRGCCLSVRLLCCRRRRDPAPGSCDSRFTQATRHMIGIAELFFLFSLLARRGGQFSFGKRWPRVVGLALKMLQIHTVCYQGLWLVLGAAITLVIKYSTDACHNQKHTIPEACIGDWTAYTQTTGAVVFAFASSFSLTGVVLVVVSFVMMLRATQAAMDSVADPNAEQLPADSDFDALRRRLVHPGRGAAWIGTCIELLLEYFIVGLPASIVYAVIPSQIALSNLIRTGHRLKYISAAEAAGV